MWWRKWPSAVSIVLRTLLTTAREERDRDTDNTQRESFSNFETQTNSTVNSHWHNLYHMPTQEPGWVHSTDVDWEWRKCAFPKGNQSVITKGRKKKRERLDRQKIADVYNKWYILYLLFHSMLLYPFSCSCNHVFYSDLYSVLLFSWAQRKWIISCHISVLSTVCDS